MHARLTRPVVRSAFDRSAARRGSALIFAGVMLFVFCGIVAFSVDVAYMHLSRVELRTATDAAARAAGEALSRTQDPAQARQAAKDIALANEVDGAPLILDDADIVAGHSARQSDGKWTFTADGTPVNAFRIAGRKTVGSPSGAVRLYFARVFGHGWFEPTSRAAAVRVDRDIVLVVDRSSSMKLATSESSSTLSSSDTRFCASPNSESRWVALQGAVQTFVTALDATPQIEHVGLVSFATTYSGCKIDNLDASIDQVLTENASTVNTAMANLTDTAFNGGTNTSAGIDKARTMLNDPGQTRPYAKRVIVLMTDGQYNAGRDPSLAAQDAKNDGIVIYTITFGDGLDQTEMQNVATITGGKHYHAGDEQTLNAIFDEIARSVSAILTE